MDSALHGRAHQLADAAGIDMVNWWQATAGSYLASVPKSRQMNAVRKAVSDEVATSIATMKKADMVAAAEQYLDGQPLAASRPASTGRSNRSQ